MILKKLIRKIKLLLRNTKGEYIIGTESNEYSVCGVRYIVSSRFSKNGTTLKEHLEKYLKSDFADLTSEPKNNILETNYVCSTAGKED